MPETVSIDRVEKMLAIATFHLLRFNSEHSKFSDRDLFAMEAYLVACLHVGSSVVYTLANRDEELVNPFVDKVRSWKARLLSERKDDYHFFFRMVDHRDSAVHASTVPTTVAVSAIPAHLVPRIDVSGPSGISESRLILGGIPASAQARVLIDKLRLDDADAIGTCKRFLGLLDELVQYCKGAGS